MVEVQSYKVDALPAPFSLLNYRLGLFSVVRFPWLHHIPSLADGTMKTQLNDVK
jgi:hypothetical protein